MQRDIQNGGEEKVFKTADRVKLGLVLFGCILAIICGAPVIVVLMFIALGVFVLVSIYRRVSEYREYIELVKYAASILENTVSYVEQLKVLEERSGLDTGEGLTDEEIEQIEATLNITLPSSFRYFISCCDGIKIKNTGEKLVLGRECISVTQRLRKETGLPDSYLVIGKDVNHVHCLSTRRMSLGECKVVSYYGKNESYYKKDNFFDFLKSVTENYLSKGFVSSINDTFEAS